MKNKLINVNLKYPVALMFAFCGYVMSATISVSTTSSLQQAMKSAQSGDVIVIKAGTYAPGSTTNSGDPGNNPTGKGAFYVGNDGAENAPIVIVGADAANPPVLQGTGVSTDYVVHVTGQHVILKNLKITSGLTGVVFDNASHGIMEDCQLYNFGNEALLIRDGSSNVKISRNTISNTGNSNGSKGNGILVGSKANIWGGTRELNSTANDGSDAAGSGYGGIFWDVQNTQILCNNFSGGISGEIIQVREGTQHTVINNNSFSAAAMQTKGAVSTDDCFITLSGINSSVANNDFCFCGGPTVSQVVEEKRSDSNVPASLTNTANSWGWTDGSSDANVGLAADNSVVTSLPAREGCEEFFPYTYTTSVAPSGNGMTYSVPAIIQAEEYVNAYDNTAGNAGVYYRADDVDVQVGGSGYVLGSVTSADWTEYKIDVEEAGDYNIMLSVSTNVGLTRTLDVSVDGALRVDNLAITDSGWSIYTGSSASLGNLTAGTHTIKVQFSGNANLDYFLITPTFAASGAPVAGADDVRFKNKGKGTCLQGTMTRTDPVSLATCGTGTNQKIDVEYYVDDAGLSEAGHFKLVFSNSGFAWDTRDEGSIDAEMLINYNNTHAERRITLPSAANGFFQIMGMTHGFCLEAQASGNPLWKACNKTNNNQLWSNQ